MTVLLPWGLWFLGVTLAAAAGAVLATRRTRGLAIALGAVGIVTVWWCPPNPALLRAACVLLYFWGGFVRVLELAYDGRTHSAGNRVWHALAIFDVRQVRYGAPRFSTASLVEAALAGTAATATGLLALSPTPDVPWVLAALVRYGAGAACVYFGLEASFAVLTLVYRLFGIYPPRMHDHPILSLTVAEFWGMRWNRVVSGWLRTRFFLPFARRGRPGLGVVGAFTASASLHAYFIWAAVGAELGVMMAVFFLVQCGLVLIERKAAIDRLSAPLKRLWTLAAVLCPSPLFLEPFLTLFER